MLQFSPRMLLRIMSELFAYVARAWGQIRTHSCVAMIYLRNMATNPILKVENHIKPQQIRDGSEPDDIRAVYHLLS